MKKSRATEVIVFSTLTVAVGLTACAGSSASPPGSSAAGSSSGGSAGGSNGVGGLTNAGRSGGDSSSNAGRSGGDSANSAGASFGGTSGTATGGRSFGGTAGANTSGSTQGGAAWSSMGGSSGSSGGSPAAGAGGSPSGGWHFPPSVSKPRIMIVGDSISAGPGCYKKYLLQDLTDNHYSNFEFVGEYSDDCGGVVRHSAVSCSTAEQYTRDTFTMSNCSVGTTFKGLSRLMTSQKPDVVMLQLGVNDVWANRSLSAILASYTTLVQQARAANPVVVLAVARIQKIRPNCSTDPALTNQAQALESAVPDWAKQLSTPSSPIFTADLWTNSDWSMTETIDCVHPNDAGAKKMGSNWFDTLKTILTPTF